jgi:S1-C subfamily serine protease
MPFTGAKKSEAMAEKPKSQQGGRRVSTGTMPDFAFSGSGVKIGAVSDDSPAAKAGLLKGDVITAFDGKPVESLKDYSNYLKEHQPGDEVTLTIDRDGEKSEMKLVLAER